MTAVGGDLARLTRGLARTSYARVGNFVLGALLAGRWLVGRARARGRLRRASPIGVRGVRTDTPGWLARRPHGAARLVEVFPPARPARTRPVATRPHPNWDPVEFSRDVPAAFVALVANGRAYGSFGAVIAPDGWVLGDVSLLHPRYAFRSDVLRIAPRGDPKWVGARACVLSVEWGHNYYHWLFDVLPRLELVRRAGVDLSSIDAFVINRTSLPFQNQVWAALGLPLEKVIETDAALHVTSDELIVVSSLQESAHASRWACDFLRTELGPAARPDLPRRIYVSRGDTANRRLSNEDACVELLAELGFVTVSLSGMPITEQAATFAAADVVVGAHGAGLSNLVFCQPGTTVLELHSPMWPATNFWELSACIDLDYRYLMGQPVTPMDALARGLRLRRADDFHVDLGALRASLAALGVRVGDVRREVTA